MIKKNRQKYYVSIGSNSNDYDSKPYVLVSVKFPLKPRIGSLSDVKRYCTLKLEKLALPWEDLIVYDFKFDGICYKHCGIWYNF